MSRFGKTTRILRKQQGLTLEKLARKAGTHKGYLSGIENGRVKPPSEKMVKKIARALAANEKELLILAYLEKVPKLVREEIENALKEKNQMAQIQMIAKDDAPSDPPSLPPNKVTP